MDQTDMPGQLGNPASEVISAPAVTPSPLSRLGAGISPLTRGGTCPTCDGAIGLKVPYSYVYALGRIEPRFPSLALEKEFAQALGRDQSAGLTDRQAFQSTLAQRPNRTYRRERAISGNKCSLI